MSIKPEYLTLDALLQKRLFRIPQYQRTYSWETQQRRDLFSDLAKLAKCNNDRHHFMSTVVCLKTATRVEVGTDEYEVLDVVDGQQRLTTLVVLLKAISLELANGSAGEQAEGEKLSSLLAKRDQSLILLQTNHQSSQMFSDYLLDGTTPNPGNLDTLAEQNLSDAFDECREFVTEWKDQGDILSLLKLVKNRLDFIFYSLEDEGAVYTVFEVLNSRGLDVDALDKCKSMLMGIAFEKLEKDRAAETINELNKCWERLYTTLGIRAVPGNEVLRFTATLWHQTQVSKTLSDGDAITALREYCEAEPARTVDVAKRLLNVAKAYERLLQDPKRKAVTLISQARLLAIAILATKNLSEPDRKVVLDEWEKVTFRIYGWFRKDARTAVGEYIRLARDVIKGNMNKAGIIARISAIGQNYPIDEAIKALKGADCYNEWEDELRYVLFRYEEYLASQQGSQLDEDSWAQIWKASANKTIEHIFPQNPSAAWTGKVKSPQKWVHSLGNLVLLPPTLNRKAGNKGFSEKRIIYKASRLRMLDDIVSKSDWTSGAIEARETALLAWVRSHWS